MNRQNFASCRLKMVAPLLMGVLLCKGTTNSDLIPSIPCNLRELYTMERPDIKSYHTVSISPAPDQKITRKSIVVPDS